MNNTELAKKYYEELQGAISPKTKFSDIVKQINNLVYSESKESISLSEKLDIAKKILEINESENKYLRKSVQAQQELQEVIYSIIEEFEDE